MVSLSHAAEPSCAQYGLQFLERVNRLLDVDLEFAGKTERIFRSCLQGWGRQPVGGYSGYPTFANDNAPFEFSVAWTRDAFEFRFLVEPLGWPPNAAANAVAARDLVRRLSAEPNFSPLRYERVEDLFLPDSGGLPPFAAMQAVAFGSDGEPSFKIYLNPNARPGTDGVLVVGEAMTRLGLAAPWRRLVEHIETEGVKQVPEIFALDLNPSRRARVKVYFRNDGLTARQVDDVARVARIYEPGSFRDVILRIMGGEEPSAVKASVSCFAFREGSESPDEVAIYCPLDAILPNDAVATARISGFMKSLGIGSDGYVALMDGLSDRPLTETRIQSWMGYRGAHEPRITSYFAPTTCLPLPPQEG